jgi:hypothetical protein
MVYFNALSQYMLGGKARKNLSEGTWPPGQKLNSGLPEYEEELPTQA